MLLDILNKKINYITIFKNKNIDINFYKWLNYIMVMDSYNFNNMYIDLINDNYNNTIYTIN